MRSVEAALKELLAGAASLEAERVGLVNIKGRVLAKDAIAAITQPPFSASAMDGYAVRFSDLEQEIGVQLMVIGEAPAGAPFDGVVGQGQAVRIFTGGVVPEGADHVVIQEEVECDGHQITIKAPQNEPRNIRPAGVDFVAGDVLASAGTELHAVHGSIFAAANLGAIDVVRKPRVGLFSNGDELREPGAILNAGEIINSNHYALAEMIMDWGGEPDYLGCAPDDEAALKSFFERAKDYDILTPIGGASVGDYDYVKSAFAAVGGEIVFEKVAVRPGKPLWYGRLGNAHVIGLPGNPASAIVTAALFIKPVVKRLAGLVDEVSSVFEKGQLQTSIKANGRREAYLRGRAVICDGVLGVTPAGNQDSSLLAPFCEANVLIRRPVDAPAALVGDDVEIVRIR